MACLFILDHGIHLDLCEGSVDVARLVDFDGLAVAWEVVGSQVPISASAYCAQPTRNNKNLNIKIAPQTFRNWEKKKHLGSFPDPKRMGTAVTVNKMGIRNQSRTILSLARVYLYSKKAQQLNMQHSLPVCSFYRWEATLSPLLWSISCSDFGNCSFNLLRDVNNSMSANNM